MGASASISQKIVTKQITGGFSDLVVDSAAETAAEMAAAAAAEAALDSTAVGIIAGLGLAGAMAGKQVINSRHKLINQFGYTKDQLTVHQQRHLRRMSRTIKKKGFSDVPFIKAPSKTNTDEYKQFMNEQYCYQMHVIGGLPIFRLPYPGFGVSASYVNLHGKIDNVPIKNLPATPNVNPPIDIIPDDIISSNTQDDDDDDDTDSDDNLSIPSEGNISIDTNSLSGLSNDERQAQEITVNDDIENQSNDVSQTLQNFYSDIIPDGYDDNIMEIQNSTLLERQRYSNALYITQFGYTNQTILPYDCGVDEIFFRKWNHDNPHQQITPGKIQVHPSNIGIPDRKRPSLPIKPSDNPSEDPSSEDSKSEESKSEESKSQKSNSISNHSNESNETDGPDGPDESGGSDGPGGGPDGPNDPEPQFNEERPQDPRRQPGWGLLESAMQTALLNKFLKKEDDYKDNEAKFEELHKKWREQQKQIDDLKPRPGKNGGGIAPYYIRKGLTPDMTKIVDGSTQVRFSKKMQNKYGIDKYGNKIKKLPYNLSDDNISMETDFTEKEREKEKEKEKENDDGLPTRREDKNEDIRIITAEMQKINITQQETQKILNLISEHQTKHTKVSDLNVLSGLVETF